MEPFECPSCKRATVERRPREKKMKVGRYTVTDRSGFAWVCPACGESFSEGEELGDSHRRVAIAVLHDVKDVTGEEFKHLRKLVGLTQKELAELLDVAPETISRLETGTHAVGMLHRRALADIAASIVKLDGDVEKLLEEHRTPKRELVANFARS